MSEGFPLLTTKKMPFRLIATELMWFLRGDTNIKYLVDNDCHIWDGDVYKNYLHKVISDKDIVRYLKSYSVDTNGVPTIEPYSKDEFINRIKNDDEFAKTWGELGPVYGKQWRHWTVSTNDDLDLNRKIPGGYRYSNGDYTETYIDQIQNLIHNLKTNPDSRRLMVSAWNVGELDEMTLPPCHYGFQVYTRELSLSERTEYKKKRDGIARTFAPYTHQMLDGSNIPTRAISLMWNQRSVDTFLGLPFNIASYGLLLEIIATAVNMIPDELIGNLGDTHLYLNHVDQAKEQIGREFSFDERVEYFKKTYPGEWDEYELPKDNFSWYNIPTRTREPFPLPTININTEWWPTESGECGVGPIDAVAVFEGFSNDNFCKCLLEEDLQLGNYQSHPTIKAPLSN